MQSLEAEARAKRDAEPAAKLKAEREAARAAAAPDQEKLKAFRASLLAIHAPAVGPQFQPMLRTVMQLIEDAANQINEDI